MSQDPSLVARLEFLSRVTEKECNHLLDTDARLFAVNLDKAEKFGLVESIESWMEMRRLRNQMVHEYIEDLVVLASALRAGHSFVPALVAAARRCVTETLRILQRAG